MATVIEPRRLADLEQDAIARVEQEWARRAQGVKPWTTTEYVERVARVHAHYNQRREWLRLHKQDAAMPPSAVVPGLARWLGTTPAEPDDSVDSYEAYLTSLTPEAAS